jgi:hypothetical protein
VLPVRLFAKRETRPDDLCLAFSLLEFCIIQHQSIQFHLPR